MDVHIMSHFWTLKAFLPHMTEQRHGHIVTISSIIGKMAAPGLADYAASKFAAVGLHTGLSEELRGTGVVTTNICPSSINTGMFTGGKLRFPSLIPENDQHDVVDKIVKAILLNENEVTIPSRLGLFLLVKQIIPLNAYRAITDFLGQREFMTEFTGRNEIILK